MVGETDWKKNGTGLEKERDGTSGQPSAAIIKLILNPIPAGKQNIPSFWAIPTIRN